MSKSDIQRMIEGLQILAKYPDAGVCAVHDKLFAGPPGGGVALEDQAALEALEWFEDEDSWAMFT